MNETKQELLLSHCISDNNNSIKKLISEYQARIKKEGDKPDATVEEQQHILNQLKQFELGRYLLKNRGLNGYWTHYILTYPWREQKAKNSGTELPITKMESFILNQAPSILATQQRFRFFLKQNQLRVKSGAKLACIPSGMMGELLYLDYSDVDVINLYGIDYDQEALEAAKGLSEKKELFDYCSFIKADAFGIHYLREFDLISSNGLNIYESSDERVMKLYQNFKYALKEAGTLVTSFLTHPPGSSEVCEWDFSKINLEHARLQKIIFSDILKVKWQCYQSSDVTQQQLMDSGFIDIKIFYDDARMFPTVVATRQ